MSWARAPHGRSITHGVQQIPARAVDLLGGRLLSLTCPYLVALDHGHDLAAANDDLTRGASVARWRWIQPGELPAARNRSI